eukprot:jgi/Botrbrau1/9629/Bobra.0131s0009.1
MSSHLTIQRTSLQSSIHGEVRAAGKISLTCHSYFHLRTLGTKRAERRGIEYAVRCSASELQQGQEAASPAWFQKNIELPPCKRGCHVITRLLLQQLPEVSELEVGLVNFFIKHTSASLTINENASPDVPLDLNDTLDRIVPEGHHYRHLDEGLDDMPAHVKSSLMGPSLTVPIRQGRLALGTWQGIYLNEHRNYGGSRHIVVTIQGQRRSDRRTYSAWQ